MTINPIDLLRDIPDPEECRRRANECERMAKDKTADDKTTMLAIAKHWRDMAEAIEHEKGQ